MRVEMNQGEASWYLWLIYVFCERGCPHLHLKAMLAPQSEESRFMTPEELEGCSFFEVV
jgi:hypothetical protein